MSEYQEDLFAQQEDIIRLQESEEQGLDAFFPWLDSVNYNQLEKPLSTNALLTHEILCYLEYMKPTDIERKFRDYLVHRIRTSLQAKFPDAIVSVCGGDATGLVLPDSVVEVVVQFDPTRRPRFRDVASTLREDRICRTTQIVNIAGVPCIQFEDAMTKINMDIFLNDASRLNIAREANRMLGSHPGARQLTLIVKHFLSLREDCEIFTTSLGEYAIICLVVSCLQVHPKVASGSIDPMQNLGILLLDLFQLYGINFNWEQVAIDLRGNGRYCGKTAGDTIITIREPLNVIYRAPFLNEYCVILGFQFAYLVLSQVASGVENELREANYQNLAEETMEDPLRASMLCSIVRITPKEMLQREHMVNCFIATSWRGQAAAQTFSFV